MNVTISRAIAGLILGMGLSSSAVFSQEAANTATPTQPAMISVTSVDALFDGAREALRAAADKGDAAASLAMARSLFNDADAERQLEGVSYLERAADAGARDAIEQLGRLYASGGYGVAPDPVRARDAYEKAVDAGSLEALVALGQLLLNTDFTAEGQKRGLDMLVKAADAGQVSAANRLAEIYLGGIGVEPDAEKAMGYYGIGLVSGSGSSVLGVGDALRVGTRQLAANPEVALALFQRAAEGGDTGAKRRIASMHLNGEAVPQDVAGGERMLTQLADGGDAQSLIELGDIYRAGVFVPNDMPKAVSFYEKAAALNYNAGRTRLASLYMTGAEGVPINVRRSLDYYNEAVDAGSAGAMRSLADLYLEGTVLTPDPEQAIALLERAATFGDSSSAERLATLYAQNDPFPADYEKVQKYLDLSLAMGNTRAVLSVATAIAEGPLARAHSDASYQLLSNAVNSGVPGAAARLARLQLDGVFPAQGMNGVMSMLNASATKGDQAAARFLLQLYRDGYGMLLQPDVAAAEALLKTVEPVLGVEGTAIERISLAVQRGESPETLEEISAQFDKLTPANVGESLNDLRRESARAYVYVLQVRLQALGLYTGALNGTLDGTTIRAFREACSQAGASQACAPGPLTAGTARALANFVWSTQTQG